MEGTRISHYQVTRRLGRGGMGEVYEATDLDLGRRVALKFLAPELAADPESSRRFEREARSAAALKHPHIATLHAFVRDGQRSFLDMELIEGQTLRERIRGGPLPVEEALRVGRDVASALAEAHAAGIVHRDIKPENLMFDGRGDIKVMDFGLAQAVHSSRITMTGTTLGTAAYMAPEAIQGSAGPPADVFALGMVIFEMVARALPFRGDAPLAVLYSIANEEPLRLRDSAPHAPEGLERLVLGMLSKDSSRRPAATAAAAALEALRSGAPLPPAGPAAPEAPSGAITAPIAARPRTEEVEVTHLPAAREGALVPAAARRRRRGFALTALLLVAVAGWLGVRRWSEADAAARREDAIRLNNRGITALRADSLGAARSFFQAAVAKDPRNGLALVNLGTTWLREGDPSRAESLYVLVLNRLPQDRAAQAAAHYNLGELQLDAGEWSGAVEHLTLSLELDSSLAAPYNNLGRALIGAGRLSEASSLLTRAIVRFPGEPMLHKNAGLVELAQGDLDGALRHADLAARLAPELAAPHGVRAMALARKGFTSEARDAWRRFLELKPSDAERAEVERDLKARGLTLS